MKKYIAILIATFFVVNVFGAVDYSLGKETQNYHDEIFDVTSDETQLTIHIRVPSLYFKEINYLDDTFTGLGIPDESYTVITGDAQLPVIRRLIEIPIESEPTLIIDSISWTSRSLSEMGLPRTVFPVQPSLSKNEDPTEETP